MKCAPFQRRLAEQHAVVGQDADRIAVEVREAAHERLAVALLELVELRGVDQARDDLVDVVRLAQVGRDDRVEVGRVDHRWSGVEPVPRRVGLLA